MVSNILKRPLCIIEPVFEVLSLLSTASMQVEMEHSKRLNVQRLPVGRSPRRVLYHPESKMLLVLRSDHAGSDICCVDPLTGSIHHCFQLDEGEIGRCMQLWYQRGEQLLLVGTGLTAGKPIMPNGEPERYLLLLLTILLDNKHSYRGSVSVLRYINTIYKRRPNTYVALGLQSLQC